MNFHFEHRSNGLTYVTVIDEGKNAGAFSLVTGDALIIQNALNKAGVACTDQGELAGPAAEQD